MGEAGTDGGRPGHAGGQWRADGGGPKKEGDDSAAAMPKHGGPEPGAGIMRADRTVPDLSFSVRQIGRLYAADGTPCLPQTADAAAAKSASVTNPVLASFTQHTYEDASVGASMPYNLFLPAGYDGKKQYPLLIFIPDASANINEPTTPLFQGNGATVFADPVWQAKHPCIVLALQYTDDLVTQLGMMTTDANGWSQGLQLAWDTIEHVTESYAVDPQRIYGTGQSQGGMANIAIADRHPDFFAAQYLVACQWKTEEMAAMKDSRLWITVSTGDTKAHPGMDAATALWESLGTRVSRNAAPWNNKSSVAILDAAVRAQAKEGAPINYTVFADGNHMYTWSFAYNIDAIRDWLFAQKKA